MPYYFAYGSDMSFRQMQQRMLEEEIILEEDKRWAARLEGWTLRFDKAVPQHPEIGLACIHHKEGSVVEGVLYELPERAFAVLDRYEALPHNHYSRELLQVQSKELGAVDAQVFVPHPDHIKPGLRPSRNHLYRLLAAERFLSPAYFAALKKTDALKVAVDEDGIPHPPQIQAKKSKERR